MDIIAVLKRIFIISVLLVSLAGLYACTFAKEGAPVMRNNIINPHKMLSHRVRGFSEYEHTFSAFKKALQSDVKYIEIDTRVTMDGEIFVYHDHSTDDDVLGQTVKFSTSNSEAISDLLYDSNEKIPKLEEFLQIFSAHKDDGKVLCIDIKDYGFEQKHYDLIAKYNLAERIVWVTWIPQTCLRLYEINKNIPIVLSHWNVMKYDFLGGLLVGTLKNNFLSFQNYVAIGINKYNQDLDDYSHGYQHSLICNEIPQKLVKVLSETGGGICVNVSMVDEKLITYCQENQLRLFVFSVNDLENYNKYSKHEGIDVIFCDDKIGRIMTNG